MVYMKEEFATECTTRGCRTNRMRPEVVIESGNKETILLSEVSGKYKKPDLGAFV